MKYNYFNKKFIVCFLIIIFVVIILFNIYCYYFTNKEGFKIKKIGKSISKGVTKVSDTTKQAAEKAKRQAEEAAAKAKKLAEQLSIQNTLAKLIEPIINLKNTITNSLNFMKQF